MLSDLPDEVAKHEPTLALDGGADGLDMLRRIVPWALRALKPKGFLAVELHETTLDAAAQIARTEGFGETSIVSDLNGLPRVLVAKKA